MAGQAKILIVDDEPFNVDLLEQELEDLGYLTLTASNGQQAVDLVRSEAPDLVLLDVMMPVMDGFTACRLLKEDEATRLTPIIIMTALDRVDDRIKGIEAGADDFLTKPVNDQELLSRMRTALRMKAAVDARVHEVTRLSDHFAKFVPEPVKLLAAVDSDSAELSGKVERDVSVLMLDVSGYSRLSEQLPTEQLSALVERYLSAYLDPDPRGRWRHQRNGRGRLHGDLSRWRGHRSRYRGGTHRSAPAGDDPAAQRRTT